MIPRNPANILLDLGRLVGIIQKKAAVPRNLLTFRSTQAGKVGMIAIALLKLSERRSDFL